MATLDDSSAAFQKMVAASKALIADPTNREKYEAAKAAMHEYRRIHQQALRDAGFPEHVIGTMEPDED